EQIHHAIEAVPTEKIQQALESILGRVRDEVSSLGLSQIGDTIENGFHQIETFINDHINQALGDQVHSALQGLLDSLQRLPLDTLLDSLKQVVAQVEALIHEAEQALQGAFDKLSAVVAKLDDLSFKPVGDAVVGEINDLKSRLAIINPNALSDVEKLALRA